MNTLVEAINRKDRMTIKELYENVKETKDENLQIRNLKFVNDRIELVLTVNEKEWIYKHISF